MLAVGCGVSGPDLSERLCAEPAGGWAGGVVYDRASGLPDPVAGDHGEDRHRVSHGGGPLRCRQRDPGGAVRQGRPQDRGDAPYLARQARTGRSGVAAIGITSPEVKDCVAKTKIVTRGTDVTVNAFYKNSRIKQYLKDGRALRIETVVRLTRRPALPPPPGPSRRAAGPRPCGQSAPARYRTCRSGLRPCESSL